MVQYLDFKTPETEEDRILLIEQWGIEDIVDDGPFDEIANVAAQLCDAPTGLVTVVTRDSQCNLGKYGTAGRRVPREIAFCDRVVRHKKILIVEDTEQDPRFVDNKLVTGSPHIRFYVGIPIFVDGRIVIGTLCVTDSQTRRLTVQQRASLMGLVYQVEQKLIGFVARSAGAAEISEKLSSRAQEYQKKLFYKEELGTHLLTKLRQHIEFLRIDMMIHNLDVPGQGESESLREDIEGALNKIDQLVDTTTSLLRDPRGMVNSNTTVALSDIIKQARRALSPEIRARGGGFEVSNRLEKDFVFGDPTLLEDLVVRLIDMTLREVNPEDDIKIIVDDREEGIEFNIYSEGEMPSESVRKRLFTAESGLDEDTDIDFDHDFEWEYNLRLCSMIVDVHNGQIELCEVRPGLRCLKVILPSVGEQITDEYVSI